MSENGKLNPKDVAPYENDLLAGLLAAAEDKENTTALIEIARGGKVFFSFHVHPLGEAEWNACRDRATTYTRKNKLNMKLAEDTNVTRYRSLLIYEATTQEDKEKLWNNKTAWEKLGIMSGPDLIEKVLHAGEKDAVVAKIELISGYKDEVISGEAQEEIAKN